jgi:hypothetical protein
VSFNDPAGLQQGDNSGYSGGNCPPGAGSDSGTVGCVDWAITGTSTGELPLTGTNWDYILDAQEIGANYFNLERLYNVFDYFGDAWVANQGFLNASIARGQCFLLNQAPFGGVLVRDLWQRSPILV